MSNTKISTPPPDGDDDGDRNLSVCADGASFDLKYDDDNEG